MKFNPQKYQPQQYTLDSLPDDNIDRLMFDLIPQNKTILELGSGGGHHTQILVKQKNATVTVADIVPSAVKRAKKWAKFGFCVDFDKPQSWKKLAQKKPYQVVVAANILEHLHDPWEALTQIHTLLAKNGVLIMVVPNIAFWRARLRLLTGKWEYEDYGIFDRTHLRFFTVETARRALLENGFSVEAEAYDPAGGAKFLTPLLKQFLNAYAHQVVFKAVKKSQSQKK